MVAAAPSGMQAVRNLERLDSTALDASVIEATTHSAIEISESSEDRLWIVRLQWALRRMEEAGRIDDWLQHVRTQTKLRPAFLTGINFKWVDQVVEQRRLRPFRNFNGAYLFLLSVIEAHADTLRLRLVLEPLLKDLDYEQAVEQVMNEFGTTAPAIIRNYMTTQNMLVSGLAANYVAALDQRVRALEECIRRFDYGPLLTEEIYENEARTLTAELLLTSVNAGKFEIPWDAFRNDTVASQSDLYFTVQSLKTIGDEDPRQSSMVETLIPFANGRSQSYRYRVRQGPLFALVSAILDGFIQHPAFGLEVILSGRFRHNNLLHELWSAISGVTSATIASVPAFVKIELIEEYKTATERVLDAWSSTYLQSVRPQKPRGLFDLVPNQRQMDDLLTEAIDLNEMPAIVDVAIEWLKSQLREQVDKARQQFIDEVPQLIAVAFDELRDRHEQDPNLRTQDVALVHAAVLDATRRRIDELRTWFDGVDATSNATISLNELVMAASTLFENVIKDRKLQVEIDPQASEVSFAPGEVKIAFDMLREVLANALRHGRGEMVVLHISKVEAADRVCFEFANLRAGGATSDAGTTRVPGSRFTSVSDALFREGNSGLSKIAAIAATLAGQDVVVESVIEADAYTLRIPVRTGNTVVPSDVDALATS